MIEFIARIISMLFPNKKFRRKIRGFIKTLFYARKIYKTAAKIGKNFRCGPNCTVSKTTYIGDFVRLNNVKISDGGKVEIGNYCQFGTDIEIFARNHNYDNGTEIPYDETFVHKDIKIEDFVWCGSHVIILPGTKIGEGAIIQAGAVVHGKIPPYAIAGGNPCKIFKYRDIEHFNKLKNQKRYISDIN